MKKYIIAVDQSTQNTKAFLFDENGYIVDKVSKAHAQLINEQGWVSHDLEEIYINLIYVVKELMDKTRIDQKNIVSIGISNQRETAAAWSKFDGKPYTHAIVWQCARAVGLCEELRPAYGSLIRAKTGLNLSPYFSAAKFSWLLKNVEAVRNASARNELCFGTVDSWLLFRLTGGKEYKTEFSNASRTQLLNLNTLEWDNELCGIFNIPMNALPTLCESNSLFGYTDFEGILDHKVPIHSILGDSQSALFGHGCWERGSVKATIGTGSSVMMNIGSELVIDKDGLSTSIAWKINGVTNYVIEGNVNYAGAIIKWLQEDLKLVESSKETEILASQAFSGDSTYLVPAFTGLGAPYWEDKATAVICGMTRTTGKAEVVKASLDSIAYQIEDILSCIHASTGHKTSALKVDGGVTTNNYLMQFQSNVSDVNVMVPNIGELSAVGTAFNAGIATGVYHQNMDERVEYTTFQSSINAERREELLKGWKLAIGLIQSQKPKLVTS